MEILTLSESGQWLAVLEKIGTYAFYHLPAFYGLYESLGLGKAIMPVFQDSGYAIAFPILVRDVEIPGVVEAETGLRDAISVPGFAGPVASAEIPEAVRRRFVGELQGFFEQSGIISVYARLNPLTNPPGVLDGYGETVQVGVTVSIDLTDPSDVQRARYRQGHRYEINRLRKLGFVCEEVGPEYIDDFLRVYYDAMDRVHASREYYFDRRYIEYLLTDMSDVAHLFVCRQDGVIASAFIETACKGIMEVYIGGTASEYRRLAPDKLVYDTVREWGTSAGARVYHLGGGVGAQRDSLYEFKMGFGGEEHAYSTWRHVVNPEIYDELYRTASQRTGVELDESYFPRYRHPMLINALSGIRDEVKSHDE